MTASHAHDPGFARRSDTYDHHLTACRHRSTDEGLTRLKVDKALALGTAATLTPQERCLMMALLAHLDVGATAADATSVWPGAKRLCSVLAISESSLRRLKGSLEEKGFLLRRYDHRNRPLRGGAIDLKPFLLQVPALLGAIAHQDEQARQDRDDRAKDRDRSLMGAQALNLEPPNRNPPFQTLEADKLRKSRSFQRAVELWPSVITEPNTAITATLGEERGAKLFAWAERRHGDNAWLALAVASTDPRIREPGRWFAWFTTTSQPVDLDGAATRILDERPKTLALPEPKDEPSRRFTALFSQRFGEGPTRAYLQGCDVRWVGDRLEVRLPTQTAARRLTALVAGAEPRLWEEFGAETIVFVKETQASEGKRPAHHPRC